MRKLIQTTLAAGAFLLLAVFVVWLWLAQSLKPDLLADLSYSKALYANDGELLRLTLSADQQYRLWQPLDDIPKALQKATLLYEDQHFYNHPGINPFALLRAVYSSYIVGERRIGASTITMQLARLRYHLQTNTLAGKFQQLRWALLLEYHYSKRDILEAYLNLAPYGGNIQGVAAASLVYFHKQVNELTEPEALLLAVVPQNPNRRRLSSEQGYVQASRARARLLLSWQKAYALSSVQLQPLALPLQVYSTAELPFLAPHFVDALVQSNVEPSIVYTSLDLNLQRQVEEVTTRYITQHQTHGLHNAAVMVVDYRSMQVRAELGSVDYFNATIHGQVNGTRALRSPGSTLKPLIYALALDQGLIHPNSLLKDTPKRYGAYTPENYDNAFVGPISATDALVRSRNIPAVSLMQQLHAPTFYQWLQRSEPQRLLSESHYGLALALGGNEVSMQELVQWYALLANRGEYRKISVLADGYSSSPVADQRQRWLSPEASYLVLDMLSHNPVIDRQDTVLALQQAQAEPMSIPWKTGTSFAYRDAWSIGLVGHYVVAVWLGHFDGKPDPAFIGRSAAAPLFFKVARLLQRREPNMLAHWQRVDGLNLSTVPICKSTGDLDVEYCPDSELAWFIPGVSPIKSNRIYRPVLIDKASQLRACVNDPALTETRIYEFWPSDIEAVFKQAGIAKNKAPPFLPECTDQYTAVQWDKPSISSPTQQVDYVLQPHLDQQQGIPFVAHSASDSRVLYWFVGNTFVGISAPGEVLLWKPRLGQFQLTVMDDLGRTNTQPLHVVRARVP